MPSVLVFSREINGHSISVRFDETEKSVVIEANGNLMVLVRVDSHGVAAYTPPNESDLRDDTITMDQVYKWMKSNPQTSREMLLEMAPVNK